MRKIAFINEKGGSCKTTLAVNLAVFFAARGRRTLLVDMDPQGQAGKCLGLGVGGMENTVFELLTSPLEAAQVIHPSGVENLDIIPANKRLADFPVRVAQVPGHERLLAGKLAGLRSYDFVVFDSPPSLGLINTNILLAAEEIIVPVSLTYLALDGCAEILDSVEQVRGRFQHSRLRISLVVPTLYRPTRLADEIIAKLHQHFPGRVSRTVIGYNVKIDEAQSHGKSIFHYAPWSRGAQLMEELGREVLRLSG
jgi:chromosome partitioning protein